MWELVHGLENVSKLKRLLASPLLNEPIPSFTLCTEEFYFPGAQISVLGPRGSGPFVIVVCRECREGRKSCTSNGKDPRKTQT